MVVMLRGVNVSGRNRLPMPSFAAALGDLGFEEVATYVQSGNAVVVTSRGPAAVADVVRETLADRFGLSMPLVVRTADELRAVVDANPHLAAEDDPTKLHVTFLDRDPGPSGASLEPSANAGRDVFAVVGREIYLHCPGGYGNSKLTNDFFERRLGAVATTRNWRTVQALADMAAAAGGA